MKLGIGIVGLGRMGRCHAGNLRGLQDAKLVAVAHADAQKAQAFAAEFGAEKTFPSLGAMLECRDVQAVVIASPTQQHPASVIAAAKAGKQVFCEKPLALTLAGCDEAIAAAERAGILLQIAHARRFDPPYVEAQRRIAAGEIGTPVIFRSVSRDRELAPLGYHQSGNGPIFVDMGVHDFDVARWLMQDEVAEVHAFGGTKVCPELAQFGDSDAVMANLRFDGGALGSVELFRQALYGYEIYTEVVGTKGTVRVEGLRQTALTVLKKDGVTHDAFDGFPARFRQAFADEIAAFVHAVNSESPSPVTGEDAKRALAIALAADKSRREGPPICVATAVQTAVR